MAFKKGTPIAYRLGYRDAEAPPTNINYNTKMSVPVNSFGNVKIQTTQYINGWEAGRKVLKRKLGAKIFNAIQGMGKTQAYEYVKRNKQR